MARLYDYFYIFATIAFTTYGQVILKWRIAKLGALPQGGWDKLKFLLLLLLDPLIFSGFLSAFLASLAWMAAMTKFDLSHAYPFMSLNFAIVLCLSAWILGEPLSGPKLVGVVMIMFGTIVAARG
ncbi:EamA family transporter [Cupriavidus campinensis]